MCDDDYVGETGLWLETRKTHHTRDKKSALSTHTHAFSSFDFEFLSRSHDINERKIVESFLIAELSPKLNRNSGVERYVFLK